MNRTQVCPKCNTEHLQIVEKCSMCKYEFVVSNITFNNTSEDNNQHSNLNRV